MTSSELPSGVPEQPSTREAQDFDYTALDSETRIVVQPTTEIKERLGDASEVRQEALERLLRTDVSCASLADVDFINSVHELSQEHIVELFESMDDEALEFFINKSDFLYEIAKELFSKRHDSSYFGRQ